MNARLLLRTVFAYFVRYRLRTSLIIAGIGTGVAVMVAIMPLAASARAGFFDYAARIYPTDVIVIANDAFLFGARGGQNLSLDDVEAVRASIPEIVDADPLVRVGWRELRHGANSTRVAILGVSEKARLIRRRDVATGEFLKRADVDRKARVILLGATTATRLFGVESPVGRQLFIDNRPFDVIGVLESAGADPHGGDLDHVVWIPYTTAMEELAGVDYLSEVSLALAGGERSARVAESIAAVMRERHAIAEGISDDFTVVTAVRVRERLERSFGTFDIVVRSTVAAVFALAALAVLGVLLMSVRQRATEIGLRKAFGARARDLALQITLEVSLAGLAAGAVGILIAWLALEWLSPFLGERFGMTDIRMSGLVAIASAGVAVLTALVGAALPAARAARLDPVETLR
jgi:putative ABC transport system permease protein